MNRIDDRRRDLYVAHDPLPTERPAKPEIAREELDALYTSIRDTNAALAATRAMIVDVAPSPPKTAQEKLDDFKNAFSGPYYVAGDFITARPMFRMNGAGYNQKKMEAHAKELWKICSRAGIPWADVFACIVGRPTPQQLVKVTQALLDVVKLDDPSERGIRQLQWEWGIGVDCAGYVQEAAKAVHGAQGQPFLSARMGDVFSNMKNDPRFVSRPLADLRPGDVIHLNPQPHDVGHNVIVYDHTVMTDAARAVLAKEPDADGARAKFLAGPGPIHAIVVDSSWGAGDGHDYGGFRRDTWLYDETTKQWGFVSPDTSPPVFKTSMTGPQNEAFGGAFHAHGT